MKAKFLQSLQKYIHTKHIFFPALQLLILFTAILLWLLNRGNAFQKFFTPEDFIPADNTIVTESVTVDSSMSDGGSFLKTPSLSLERGIYQIYVNYSANQEGSCVSANTSQLSPLEFHASDALLNPAYSTAVVTVELSRSVTDFTLEAFFSGSGYVTVTGINVLETSGLYKKNLFYAVLLCLFINLIWLFVRADTTGKKAIFALSGIFLAVCYPLYTDYLTVGHDIPFHLLRIEGIAEGLRNGSSLPIKIHPFWAKDYGYAVGVLYGDILLYFPAFLRILGFSVQSSYKFFVAAVNLGTILISYFSFKRMFRSEKIGVLGCLVYSTSLYRLTDIYTRAAVGEYCAIMFLPLILCGFYLCLTEADKKNWFGYAVLTSLGLTGLVQSHVLSCEMAAIVILLSCIVLVRRVLQRYTLYALASALGLSLLLNAGFLVPFLDYYGEELYVTSDGWTANAVGTFQESGLLPIQLFSLFQHSNGGAWRTLAGIANEITPGIGIFFLLGILLLGYLICFHYRECAAIRNFKPALFCLAMGCLLLYMSTCLFPWDAISAWNTAAETAIRNLQFPWRFLAFAAVFLTFAICFAVSALPQLVKKDISTCTLTAMLVLFFVNCGWYFYDFSYNNDPYRVYDASELNTMSMYSYEYLPAAVEDPSLITDNLTIPQNIAYIDQYRKQGTEIICHIVSADTQGYVDFPLNYYKYYACTNLATGEQLPVSTGYNGMLRVTFPAGFDGTIRIAFAEPLLWRLAETVSLLTLLICAGTMLFGRYAGKWKHKNQSVNQTV